MLEPPARNMMWRFGYPTPPNYEDSELFCGGIAIQYLRNNGSCGVCGDRYDHPQPRPHETGGMFATDIIARTYQPGQVIDVIVDIVANHEGYFEFSLCPRGEDRFLETEECFEDNILELSDFSGTRYYVPHNNTGLFFMQVKLPKDVTCMNCVFRWHWHSGNNWGICDDGTMRKGCGPQENYRNCADIRIFAGAGIAGPIYYSNFNETKPESNVTDTESKRKTE
ncbi:uncharacterized protein LOC111620077 [Centruroides sculpturatus]|uniref:uncharacterized protein LOC111620073 n=1 Tax=Centruroides sculpturatus TaxID=218467 RepID=UPI000C6E445C|nr:uncharacterized protein LOC111620073 [Centruroides sculpturatus]XP_023217691.1 uncharacterized protein LOC111620077 [Centruroides sculpturatus]